MMPNSVSLVLRKTPPVPGTGKSIGYTPLLHFVDDDDDDDNDDDSD